MELTIIIQAIISGLLIGGIYAIASAGLTLIFGVMEVANFAHGDFVMLGMYITFWIWSLYALDPYLCIFISAPLLFLIGLIIQKFFISPLLEYHDKVMILTIALAMILQNIVLIIWTADWRLMLLSYSTKTFSIFGAHIGFTRFASFFVALIVGGMFYLFLKKTDLGRAIRATSQDSEAANVMGINSDHMYLLAFALGSALAGVAGSILIPIYYAYPTIGHTFILVAFAVVILGGLGNYIGAFVGGLIIGIAESLGGTLIGTEWKEFIIFAVVIIILLFRPSGLLKTAT